MRGPFIHYFRMSFYIVARYDWIGILGCVRYKSAAEGGFGIDVSEASFFSKSRLANKNALTTTRVKVNA